MLVDGGDCLSCVHQEPMEGICKKHGYDAMELRDGMRECADFEELDLDAEVWGEK